MLEKLFKIENKNDAKILFGALIGPCFLILTLALSSMQTIANVDLFAISTVGLFFCLKHQKKGLYWSLGLLLAFAFYKHIQLYQNHLFELGLETSVMLGLFISYLSFEQIREKINALEVKEDKVQEGIAKAEEKLAKEIDFHERQHKNFKFEMDRLNGLLEEKTEESVTLKSLTENLRRSLAEKEEERGLEDLKVKIKEKNQLIQEYENHSAELKKTELLYNQLKGQFEDKKDLLQTTRKELFLIKEEAEKLKRESEENNSENNPAVRELQQEFGKMHEELARFEKDNNALENVVTKVINENDHKASLEKVSTEEKIAENSPAEIEKQPVEMKEQTAEEEQVDSESNEKEEIIYEKELALEGEMPEEAPSDFSDNS